MYQQSVNLLERMYYELPESNVSKFFPISQIKNESRKTLTGTSLSPVVRQG